MSYPETHGEWWQLLHDNWGSILVMAGDQLELNSPAYDEPGNPESPMTGRTIVHELLHLKNHRNSKIARYLNAIWGNASDSYAYTRAGWDVLCDLCSEEYVLYDNELLNVAKSIDEEEFNSYFGDEGDYEELKDMKNE